LAVVVVALVVVCVAGIVSVGAEVSKKRLDRLIRIAFMNERVFCES
jgi:hypothetical protein